MSEHKPLTDDRPHMCGCFCRCSARGLHILFVSHASCVSSHIMKTALAPVLFLSTPPQTLIILWSWGTTTGFGRLTRFKPESIYGNRVLFHLRIIICMLNVCLRVESQLEERGTLTLWHISRNQRVISRRSSSCDVCVFDLPSL